MHAVRRSAHRRPQQVAAVAQEGRAIQAPLSFQQWDGRPMAVAGAARAGGGLRLSTLPPQGFDAQDVQPSRLAAAQRAAKEFVAGAPTNVRIGVVSFAGTAAIVQGPTLDRKEVEAAIDRLKLGPSTNLYGGIALSLVAMFPSADIELEHFTNSKTESREPVQPRRAHLGRSEVEPGSYSSGAIVLLTDGQRTTGGDPLDAAQMAADRGVKVYAVGLGTAEGSIISFHDWNIRVKLDEETLKQVAQITGYFNANSADDLRSVYQALSQRVVIQKRETELTALAAALLLALAVVRLPLISGSLS